MADDTEKLTAQILADLPIPDTDPRPEIPVDGDPAGLLDEVAAFLDRFVAFPTEHDLVAVTLWAAHAHILDGFDSTPRLALLSTEPGSGKTRTLEILDLLVPRPMHVLSASPAAVFRSIKARRPTLLFDEVDTIWNRNAGDGAEDLRAMLNAGHRRGATIPRCVGPGHEVVDFPVYAAVALAGLGKLPETIMSRSVVIRMRRRLPTETVAPYRARLHEPDGHALREKLASWATSLVGDVPYPEMPDGVTDRPADVWEPLLQVADAAGGEWPGRARSACTMIVSSGSAQEASLGVRLLSDLREVFGDAEKLATASILERLNDLDEAPWGDLRGRPLDARRLAYFLKDYEVRSTKVRIDEKALQGYRTEDLWDAWNRYVVSPNPEEAEQTEHAEQPSSDSTNAVPPTGDVPEHEPQQEQPLAF